MIADLRIVSLVPSATETLFELGLGNQIVGITRYCIRPEGRVKNIPRVGGTKNPNLSKIEELKPDIVIMDQDENRIADAEFLQSRGIKLFTTFCRTVADSVQMIRDLGKFFSVNERAKTLVEQIHASLKSLPPPSIKSSLILIWRRPYMSVNADTYVHSIAQIFGIRNVFAGRSERYPKLTVEEIRHANPELVIFPDEPYPFGEKHLHEFQTLFPNVEAVLNGELLCMDGSLLTWHGAGTLRALQNIPSLLQNVNL